MFEKKIGITLSLFAVIVPALLLSGCGGLLFNYEGARIRPGYEIPLSEAGKKSGTYETRDLTVLYDYARAGDELRISGKVQFAGSLRYNFTVIRRFNLSMVLADAQGNILGNQGLLSAGLRDPDEELSFDTVVRLPAPTTSFAFTYTGRATEGGGDSSDSDGGVDTDFWQYPIIK